MMSRRSYMILRDHKIVRHGIILEKGIIIYCTNVIYNDHTSNEVYFTVMTGKYKGREYYDKQDGITVVSYVPDEKYTPKSFERVLQAYQYFGSVGLACPCIGETFKIYPSDREVFTITEDYCICVFHLMGEQRGESNIDALELIERLPGLLNTVFGGSFTVIKLSQCGDYGRYGMCDSIFKIIRTA